MIKISKKGDGKRQKIEGAPQVQQESQSEGQSHLDDRNEGSEIEEMQIQPQDLVDDANKIQAYIIEYKNVETEMKSKYGRVPSDWLREANLGR